MSECVRVERGGCGGGGFGGEGLRERGGWGARFEREEQARGTEKRRGVRIE